MYYPSKFPDEHDQRYDEQKNKSGRTYFSVGRTQKIVGRRVGTSPKPQRTPSKRLGPRSIPTNICVEHRNNLVDHQKNKST